MYKSGHYVLYIKLTIYTLQITYSILAYVISVLKPFLNHIFPLSLFMNIFSIITQSVIYRRLNCRFKILILFMETHSIVQYFMFVFLNIERHNPVEPRKQNILLKLCMHDKYWILSVTLL